MIRPLVPAALAAALLLAACDAAPTPKATPSPDTSAADAALLARIEALPPGNLHALLFRAIRDAKQDCQGIDAAARIDPIAGRPAWSAQCDSRARYVLTLQPGGVFTVSPATAAPRI